MLGKRQIYLLVWQMYIDSQLCSSLCAVLDAREIGEKFWKDFKLIEDLNTDHILINRGET